MWVRFWHKGRCGSGTSEEESTYEWMSKDQSGEVLSDMARENVPSWQTDSERGFDYGFERVPSPPENVRLELIVQIVLSKWVKLSTMRSHL